jgi:hypothetical protein
MVKCREMANTIASATRAPRVKLRTLFTLYRLNYWQKAKSRDFDDIEYNDKRAICVDTGKHAVSAACKTSAAPAPVKLPLALKD